VEGQVAAEILFRRARASPLKRLIAVNSLDANLIYRAAPVFVQRRSSFLQPVGAHGPLPHRLSLVLKLGRGVNGRRCARAVAQQKRRPLTIGRRRTPT
jgi:hypothetical protein